MGKLTSSLTLSDFSLVVVASCRGAGWFNSTYITDLF